MSFFIIHVRVLNSKTTRTSIVAVSTLELFKHVTILVTYMYSWKKGLCFLNMQVLPFKENSC